MIAVLPGFWILTNCDLREFVARKVKQALMELQLGGRIAQMTLSGMFQTWVIYGGV